MSKPFETNVSSPYGAPMGRPGAAPEVPTKVRLARVRLDSGGYDKGGAYWGHGESLWCAWNDECELYVRALSHETAKAKLPGSLRFYR